MGSDSSLSILKPTVKRSQAASVFVLKHLHLLQKIVLLIVIGQIQISEC